MTSYGRSSEMQAVEYLKQNGFQILDQNFQYYGRGRGRKGEIDIIALKKGRLHMVEVKARRNLKFGHPLSQITSAKVILLRQTAEFFFFKNTEYRGMAIQFDAIIILQDKLEYYPNAF